MSLISYLTDPVAALFICLGLGHLVGRLRIGPVAIGGVCGTLFVALAFGQFGVRIPNELKNVAFALFIYALGFTAGPQFFSNIRGGARYAVFPLIEVIVALSLTLAAVAFFQLDAGTAAGLFAGSATESAVLGTASEAISKLDLPAVQSEEMLANIATAYSLTYLFGLISIVIFVTNIAPALLGRNLKVEAEALAATLSGDEEGGDIGALPVIVERAFEAGELAGQTPRHFEETRHWTVVIHAVKRGDQLLLADLDFVIEPGDIVVLRGRRSTLIAAGKMLGREVPLSEGVGFPLVSDEVILTRREAFGHESRDLRRLANPEEQRGIFLTQIRRMGHEIPALPKTILQEGDILTLYGPAEAVKRAVAALGEPLPPDENTDFVFLGLGIVVGLLIGHLSFKMGALDLTLGLGGGALLSGLLFGWLNMRFPRHGAFPEAAAHFAKDFGLAAFIAAIGLGAGPDAIKLIKEYGLVFPILGILLSIAPAFVSLFIGAKLMKVPMPILLGAIAGQHCSTPAISALVNQAGNTTPVIGYTVTYAVANVLLPLTGPVIVNLAFALTG
ncbi:aspartate-alanine antiporter [Paracoccus aestuariivivens]|uniref:Aspartate-alanine antiporter n=1 Tax=Paracoccus aestuariivivens TaxID=1820333 RepID=A0A6L6J5L2_9RHOB|nr:aspartate-alanine antiporter [Paracoccus aestuariivivens]MTH76826.1 aspartate-alanine antiporter [Paracoccus aestuariivivens]